MRHGAMAAALGVSLALAASATAQLPPTGKGGVAPAKLAPKSAAQRPEVETRKAEIAVELAWLAEPCVFACNLGVRAEKGQLKIWGYVPSETVKQTALRLAQRSAKQHGNLPVMDGLRVHSGMVDQRVTNLCGDDMHSTAESLVRLSSSTPSAPIEVRCQADGTVVLSGYVQTWDDKLECSRCLRQLPGCAGVSNLLQVTQPSLQERAVASAPPSRPAPMQPIGKAQQLVPAPPIVKAQQATPAQAPPSTAATTPKQAPPMPQTATNGQRTAVGSQPAKTTETAFQAQSDLAPLVALPDPPKAAATTAATSRTLETPRIAESPRIAEPVRSTTAPPALFPATSAKALEPSAAPRPVTWPPTKDQKRVESAKLVMPPPPAVPVNTAVQPGNDRDSAKLASRIPEVDMNWKAPPPPVLIALGPIVRPTDPPRQPTGIQQVNWQPKASDKEKIPAATVPHKTTPELPVAGPDLPKLPSLPEPVKGNTQTLKPIATEFRPSGTSPQKGNAVQLANRSPSTAYESTGLVLLPEIEEPGALPVDQKKATPPAQLQPMPPILSQSTAPLNYSASPHNKGEGDSQVATTNPPLPPLAKGGSERALPSPSPELHRELLRAVEAVCDKRVRNVELAFRGAGEVQVTLTVPNANLGEQCASRIMSIRELLPYYVDVVLKLPQ